ADRPKRPANLGGGVRLEVPHIDVARPPLEKDKNARPRRRRPPRPRFRPGPEEPRQAEAAQGGPSAQSEGEAAGGAVAGFAWGAEGDEHYAVLLSGDNSVYISTDCWPRGSSSDSRRITRSSSGLGGLCTGSGCEKGCDQRTRRQCRANSRARFSMAN